MESGALALRGDRSLLCVVALLGLGQVLTHVHDAEIEIGQRKNVPTAAGDRQAIGGGFNWVLPIAS
jgi:hypothetical protein